MAYVPVNGYAEEGYPAGDSGGAGVYVDDYLVLTVAHLQTSPSARMTIGVRGAKEHHVEVIRRDPEVDLMLLLTTRKANKVLKVAKENAEISQRVLTVGTPGYVPGIRSWGRVAQRNSHHGTMLIDIAVMHGSSGGAVVALDGSARGKMVGMLFQMWNVPKENVIFAVALDAETVRGFLERSGVYN